MLWEGNILQNRIVIAWRHYQGRICLSKQDQITVKKEAKSIQCPNVSSSLLTMAWPSFGVNPSLNTWKRFALAQRVRFSGLPRTETGIYPAESRSG